MLRPAPKTAENMHQKDLELKSLQALEVTFKLVMYCQGENLISKQRFFCFIKTIETILCKISADEKGDTYGCVELNLVPGVQSSEGNRNRPKLCCDASSCELHPRSTRRKN